MYLLWLRVFCEFFVVSIHFYCFFEQKVWTKLLCQVIKFLLANTKYAFMRESNEPNIIL